jgi:hypothetical protein
MNDDRTSPYRHRKRCGELIPLDVGEPKFTRVDVRAGQNGDALSVEHYHTGRTGSGQAIRELRCHQFVGLSLLLERIQDELQEIKHQGRWTRAVLKISSRTRLPLGCFLQAAGQGWVRLPDLARDGRGSLGRIGGSHIVENCCYVRKELREGRRAESHAEVGTFLHVVRHDAQVALTLGWLPSQRGRGRPTHEEGGEQ